MKLFLTTALLWMGIFLPKIHAQSTASDTLNIIYQDDILVKVISPTLQKLKHQRTYQDLLDHFKAHLKSVEKQIPEYAVFRITYSKDLSLKAEEVEGIVKYQIENGIPVPAFYQNEAILQDGNLKIILRFNKSQEIFEMNYKTMISNAFLKMGKTPSILKRTFFPINQYFYSYSKNEMVDDSYKIKYNRRIGLVYNASVGFYRNDPIYELDYGLGYIFGKRKINIFYLFHGLLFRFDDELSDYQKINHFGIGLKSSRFGNVNFSLVPKKSRPESFSNLDVRISGYYPIRFGSVGVHLYYDSARNGYIPSASIGFGF